MRWVFALDIRGHDASPASDCSANLTLALPRCRFAENRRGRPTGNVPSSDEAPAVTAGASGLFQTAAAIPTLTATPRALPPFPGRQRTGDPLNVAPRRFLNTLG